jgi:hypothetical protein
MKSRNGLQRSASFLNGKVLLRDRLTKKKRRNFDWSQSVIILDQCSVERGLYGVSVVLVFGALC